MSMDDPSRQSVSEILKVDLNPIVHTPLQKFVAGPFDLFMTFLILINTVVIFAQLQYEGVDIGVKLDVVDKKWRWQGGDSFFKVVELIFVVLFIMEVIVKIGAFRHKYFTDVSNLFDLAVVITTSINGIVLDPLGVAGVQNLSFMRTVRLLRLIRAARFLRALTHLRQLRVLIRTVVSSFLALFWSMVLLGIFMCTSAILLSQLLQDFIASDDGGDPEQRDLRIWCFRFYGTAFRSMFTMFIVTFAGSWPAYALPLINGINAWYGVFFVVYVTGVVFAVIRIITALFLKETLNAANQDADMMLHEQAHERKRTTDKLRSLFVSADTSGDGLISRSEFEALMQHKEVTSYMSLLGLDTHEVVSIFSLLDDGDGLVTYHEFIDGISVLKGQSRSQDVIAILHFTKRILDICADSQVRLDGISKGLGEQSARSQPKSLPPQPQQQQQQRKGVGVISSKKCSM